MKFLLIIFFLVLLPTTANAGKAISITQHNLFTDGDTGAWIVHTPAPGWVVDEVADPIEKELDMGIMRSPGEQDSILKYEMPLPVDKRRFTLYTVMYQRNNLTGFIPVKSTQLALISLKIHF
jgi:hypothetical protein